MSSSAAIGTAVSRVHDQESFFKTLLAEQLGWPTGDVTEIGDIAYGWSAEELSAVELDKRLIDGNVWQIQPAEQGQPWGIFVLEFKNPDALSPRRGMAGVLRKVLRGLVGSRRRDPKLPSWKREHLLFICTYGWETFRFAYFRTKPDEPQATRLATFGWGVGTSNRTVCEFNLPALKWPEPPSDAASWVSAWGQAFDKEPLTRDFFKRFDKVLEAIKADLEQYQELSSAQAYTQSQLLLERLIFLYFLQNRGWLNQDRHYLPAHVKDYLDKPEAFTYYSGFLDKLFWTLSSPPGAGGDRFPGIPFLNGGLFDDDEFRQPPETRKTNPPLKVRNLTMEFVFDQLLEAFNFTVTEDTPFTQEVAVDPEMLGKVFESIVLHAEQDDPDANAPDKRKSTGSYYTPRIVVHFICREVLYQYLLAHVDSPPGSGGGQGVVENWGPRLKTVLAMDASDGLDDDKRELLKKTLTPGQAVQVLELVRPLRCCDPAVGSGAFPVGLLHELVNLRRLLTTAANGYVDPVRKQGAQWLHEAKENIVQNCLFGVDIQQQAIEICRLRLWLGLVVDYDLGLDPFTAERSQFSKAIDRISQLPNLEMNFHRGDSLHDHICGVPIVILPDRASRHADEFHAIAKLGQDLHTAKRAERKRKLRLQIVEERLDLSQRIVQEEIKVLKASDSALDSLFGLSESAAENRRRITGEIEKLEEALGKVGKDREDLERLSTRDFDRQFYPKLRKLEGADFDSPFNFAWAIDFPNIFGNGSGRGFDIIVGNPPFVTARNPVKRELWRQRWPRVCQSKYQLLCPFFELSFGVLQHGGQLGFIVSNAFMKREFGQPLVERLFPTVDIQKVVDCSGLMFPGHGTPTCLIFGSSRTPQPVEPVRTVAILPGGGDLRTAPEDSSLWLGISTHHDRPGYADARIAVADRTRADIGRWPWILDVSIQTTKIAIEESTTTHLEAYLKGNIGYGCVTRADEIYFVPAHLLRSTKQVANQILPFTVGDEVRNWSYTSQGYALFPYSENFEAAKLSNCPELRAYLSPFRHHLQERVAYGKTQLERGLNWFEYSMLFSERMRQKPLVCFADITTHNHYVIFGHRRVFKDTAPVFALTNNRATDLIVGLLNSPAALFWLKQVCFNKGAGEDEERDRFEYLTNKVEQLPVPQPIGEALQGNNNALADKLTELSRACCERGQQIPSLALKKLFESPGEAYDEWNRSLPGYAPPNPQLGSPFEPTQTLRERFQKAQETRERLRAEMIALQEEMDWLVYVAYGLLPEDHPAVPVAAVYDRRDDPRDDRREESPLYERRTDSSVMNRRYSEPLDREQRPFRLWAKAEGGYARAVGLIPKGWSAERRALWEARLAAIRDNEHIRRIEQPVYKRRWDEQWKVGNQWRCGPVAYAAEFIGAFEWWLREKAEWWLEHKKKGGPTELTEWTLALWKDARIQAAWPVAVENYAFLEADKNQEESESPQEGKPEAPESLFGDFPAFQKAFKRIVDEETVPEGFPFGTSYEELEKELKKPVPAKLTKVRGKLNVPRERFHLRGRSQYLWAGLQFR